MWDLLNAIGEGAAQGAKDAGLKLALKISALAHGIVLVVLTKLIFTSAAANTRKALNNAAGVAGEYLGTAADSVREGTTKLGQYAQLGASRVSSAVREGASAVGETAQSGYVVSRDAIADVWERYPLAICAAVLAGGFAAGMLLPTSRRETQLISKTAAKVTKRVRNKGSELLERGRKLASDTAQAVATEARRQGIAPRDLNRKIKRLAAKATNAVSA